MVSESLTSRWRKPANRRAGCGCNLLNGRRFSPAAPGGMSQAWVVMTAPAS